MRTEELDYHLPPDRIATSPAEPRDSARLLVCRRDRPIGQDVEHARVRDLPRLDVLAPGDLMVVNRTRVLPAYFEAIRAGTGGRVRGLYVEAAGDGRSLVMLESRGTLQPGERLTLTPLAPAGAGESESASGLVGLTLVESRGRGAWVVHIESDLPAETLLAQVGRTPLPPYIRKMRRQLGVPEVGDEDARRYNTVYAAEAGSVAAPTAGLHFTPDLLAVLADRGIRRAEVTLDVGLGTFEPVRAATLQEHPMHREHVRVPAETLAALSDTRRRAGRVLVVGTTTARALESVPRGLMGLEDAGWEGDTELFIHPEARFEWRHTDRLMTNFHLPRSTLLAMVAALPGVGLPRLMGWYRVAIEHGYRFYSYGDAMLVV